jgi:hypothetical protein
MHATPEIPVDADNFTLETLIKSMKDLRTMQLGDQVKNALESAKLGVDPSSLSDLIREIESDIEEHIDRLERMSAVMSQSERAHPELLDELRMREIAFQSGSDLEEVESLCEAFSRAREILAGLKQQGGEVIDVKLLFSNLPGISGLPIDAQGASDLLRGLLDGVFQNKSEPTSEEVVVRPQDLHEQFDLSRTAAPKNRLPKDWRGA